MRRAFATFLVIWIIAVASLLAAQVQDAGHRQAAAGRERLATVRAHWAARAGVEATIARLAYNVESPDQADAFRVNEDMEEVAVGELDGADWMIAHEIDKRVVLGPADAHAKVNISLMNTDALMLMPLMTEDVAESIQDWVDDDDDPRVIGAEASYYARSDFPYEPRNAPMRTITELELVAGTDPELVRGEDWDLDGMLDVDEDDGRMAWPDDNADGVLDAAWSAHVTAASWEGSQYGASGELLLDLTTAGESDLISRLGVDSEQAQTILAFVLETPSASMANFIVNPLSAIAGQLQTEDDLDPADLSPDQLAALLAEATTTSPAPTPGRINLNTAADETIDYIPGMTLGVADAIRYDRPDRQTGYTSIVDLLDIPGVTAQNLAQLYPYITVRSNVYIVSSRGRDRATGLEVHIVAAIDRATLPVAIREITIR